MFSKNEALGVFLILLAIFSVTFYNLRISERRARDAQRRDDLGSVANALEAYQEDFGFYPPAEDGKVKACRGENFDEVVEEYRQNPLLGRNKLFEGFRACEWGEDSLGDLGLFGEDSKTYLKSFPRDPKAGEGISYLYLTSTRHFQIFAYLEGQEDEQGYNADIVERNLSCGVDTCNFGKSSGQTPLDISIEEYEELLREKEKTGT